MASMPKIQFSTKRLQISKANSTMIGTVAAAAFVTVFSLVSAKALWTQRGYQAKVIDKKEQARDTLEENVKAVQDLSVAYKAFVDRSPNVLDGSTTGSGERDGDNARIVLDALPSKYDFPAVTTSLEKLLLDKKFTIDSITGVDDEVAQAQNAENSDPKPVEIPFEFKATNSSAAVKDLVGVFERSIRPFNMTKLVLTGSEGSMKIDMTAKTYYQPEKSLKIRYEDVK